MKCVLLISPGEILEGSPELTELGYKAEAYPSTQDTSRLTDTVDSELAPFFIQTIESYDSPYVRSLRSSFSRMITDPRFLDDDFIIFGESDGTPVTPAEEIRKAVEKAMSENPDVDIFRLFHDLQRSPQTVPGEPEEIFPFEYLDTGNRTRGSDYVWGTHAVVIPVKSREKVAKIFTSYRVPIDNALEVAHSRGELKMMVAKHDHFYQKARECFFDKSQRYSFKNRKIAVCLSSQGNPADLQRQVYAMMDQSYPDFHLFVAAGGVPERLSHSIIDPSFRQFMESGKLTLRYFPYKKGISGFLDTVRDLDLSEYELFARVTENTFYTPEYLKNVNLFHCDIPQHHSSFLGGSSCILKQEEIPVRMEEVKDQTVYASFVFTPKIMKQLQEMESYFSSPEQTEMDEILLRIMHEEGCSNIDGFIRGKNLQPHIITASL